MARIMKQNFIPARRYKLDVSLYGSFRDLRIVGIKEQTSHMLINIIDRNRVLVRKYKTKAKNARKKNTVSLLVIYDTP